ncbi:hypothetical protein MMC30_004785 [Trapelia coarctata]|nr:hypothetical protein [Trapelia coarctata]
MADGLPEGLVTNTEAISGDIQSVDRIATEDLAHLWRVYTTNKTLLANDVGRRLENFFWRIWSNGQIRDTIRGNSVAALFLAISDGDAIIRTTPTSSPRSSRIQFGPRPGEYQTTSIPGGQTDFPTLNLAPRTKNEERNGDEETKTVKQSSFTTDVPHPPTIEEEKGRRRGSSRPPPILKKPRAESSKQESKIARILSPNSKTPRHTSGEDRPSPRAPSAISFDLGDRRGRGSDTALARRSKSSVYDVASRSAAISSQTASPLSRGTPPEPSKASTSSGKGSKKKAGFVANSATSKRRPAVVRRKSSQSSSSNTVTQSSSSNASKVPSPRLDQQSTSRVSMSSSSTIKPLQLTSDRHQGAPADSPGLESSSTAKRISKTPSTRSSRPTSRSASPVSTGPFYWPTRDHLLNVPGAGPESQAASGAQQDWLVDKDFRTRFLTGALASRSNSTVKLSTSLEAGGTMTSSAYSPRIDKGKGKAKQIDKPEQTKPTVVDSSATVHDDDDDDEEEEEGIIMQLPRTKSQLTLLLEKDRRN